MKMKRIKLFEAFSNSDKIKKVEWILLYWALELFIKENNLQEKHYVNPSGNNKLNVYYIYRQAVDTKGKEINGVTIPYFRLITHMGVDKGHLSIECWKSIRNFLIKKRVIRNISDRYNDLIHGEITDPLTYLIKKIFINEKNKTI
jgi:hypothetical protein